MDILIQYSDIIPIQLYGHHHTDTFKLIRDKNGNVVSVGLLAPAVTPGKSTLAPETGANNPSLRLFKYDTSTGMVNIKGRLIHFIFCLNTCFEFLFSDCRL